MAVKIRLMRVGKKKQPTYRVVVADGRSPRDGRFIEIIGQYAPRQDPSFCEIDADSALAWLRKGAQPTEQVQKLLTEQGVWAQYEAERKKPAVTKLSRRGYVTGKVQPGEKLTITLKNEGKLAHTFTSTALKVDKEVQPDKKAKVTVTVPSTGAAFQFHCDFHESSGMAGAMFTTAGASVSSSGATATTNPTATNSSKSSSGGY